MIESILGFGPDPNPRPPWNDCYCAGGCGGQPELYHVGYYDGVMAIVNS